MELRQYLSVLRNRWLLILLSTVLAAVVGFSLSSSTPTYTARATLYIGPEPTSATSADRLFVIDRTMLTYATMIETLEFATPAVRQLSLDREPKDVVKATTAEPQPATQLLYISVRDEEAATAQSLANALADGFVEGITVIEQTAQSGADRFPAVVFERAPLPTIPDPTDELRTILLATIFGLLAGVAFSFLLDYLDVSLRTAADVERRLELPVLGVIPVLSTEAPFTARVSGAAERNRERV